MLFLGHGPRDHLPVGATDRNDDVILSAVFIPVLSARSQQAAELLASLYSHCSFTGG